MSTCSQDRPDRRHEQVEEGCRSTALYSSSPRNRSTSSSVCKAGALVSPSSCLDGEPHGWVPVDTHSTPVPSMTGEAVGGLRSIRAQSTTGRCATRTISNKILSRFARRYLLEASFFLLFAFFSCFDFFFIFSFFDFPCFFSFAFLFFFACVSVGSQSR